jgi:hypothetical protein
MTNPIVAFRNFANAPKTDLFDRVYGAPFIFWKVPATKIRLNLFLGGFLTLCPSRSEDDNSCYTVSASFHVFSDYMFADPSIRRYTGQATNSVVK